MRYVVHVQPEAQNEVEQARDHFDGLKPGLGDRFITAFDACLEALETTPKFQKRKGVYRHMVIAKFQYRLVFEVEGTNVFVYQVRHTSRKVSKRFGP